MASGGDDNVDDYVDYQTVVLCDGCGGMVNVTSYCINCPGNLCDTCKASHPNSNLTRTHRVLPRDHPAVVKVRKSISTPCTVHPENEYMTYCNKCKVPCCVACMTNKHAGHVCSDLQEVGERSRAELISFIKTIDDKLLPESERARAKLQQLQIYDKSKRENFRSEIKMKTKALRNQIDHLETEALSQLDKIFSDRENEANKHSSTVDQNSQYLQNLTRDLNAKLQECNNLNAVILLSECPKLTSLQLPKMSVSALPDLSISTFEMPPVQRAIGEFSLRNKKENVYSSGLSQKPSEKINTKSKQKMKLSEKPERLQCSTENKIPDLSMVQFKENVIDIQILTSFSVQFLPAHMVPSNNDEIWIVDQERRSYRYDGNGKLISKCTYVPDGSFDITRSPSEENEIIVSSVSEKRILKIGTGLTGTKSLFCTDPLSPRGICINDREQLVVGLGYRPIKIAIFDLNTAKMVQEIEKDQYEETIFDHDIYRVVQNGNGDYIVVDTNQYIPKGKYPSILEYGRVVCVSREGASRWVYDAKTVESAACDKYNNVTVLVRRNATSDAGILLLDSEGQMVGRLSTKDIDITNLLSVTITSNGLLNVGQRIVSGYDRRQGQGKVSVVRYLN